MNDARSMDWSAGGNGVALQEAQILRRPTHSSLSGKGPEDSGMQSSSEGRERRRRLDRALNGILLVVAIQFFLGMWLTLFGSFPSSNPTLQAATSDSGDPALVAHIVFGAILFLGGVVVLFLAQRDPWRPIRIFAVLAVVATVVTGIFGLDFVYSGYTNNVASFSMAVGFAAILTVYYEALVALRSHPLPVASPAGSPSKV
jgi:heme A synthase